MFDAKRYQMDTLKGYPFAQWHVAVKAFPPPSNRPPQRFWREQRDNAIAYLRRYGVDATERQGKVYVGDTMVDGSYIE